MRQKIIRGVHFRDVCPCVLMSLHVQVLFKDEGFKLFAEKYRNDEAAFFADYAAAHKKLSECGAKFEPAEGISIN